MHVPGSKNGRCRSEVILGLSFTQRRQFQHEAYDWVEILTVIDKIMFTERGEPSGAEETSSKKQYVRVPRLRILHSSRLTTLSLAWLFPFEAFLILSISGVSTWTQMQAWSIGEGHSQISRLFRNNSRRYKTAVDGARSSLYPRGGQEETRHR